MEVVIKPEKVDPTTRIVDEGHRTHIIDFDDEWQQGSFYNAVVGAARIQKGSLLGLSTVGLLPTDDAVR